MRITDSAREVLQQALQETGAHGLRVAIQETCCGKSPVIGLDVYTEDDQPETINDINIVIPEEARDVVDGLEIDLVNGELVVLNTVCGCGGHEGGCCGGHGESHHDHGEGCCGHGEGHHHHGEGCCHHE
ncbi:hypothetical protein [uncultured Faecalibaculum sp.]|uniref:hypothetical protein n=1 Tax=uncultured Faecalibaculum sp. TaxID=1729681 RepID=UPI0025D9378A|nr:hypothetical protein [uncultured Faecalibaculum sp.]